MSKVLELYSDLLNRESHGTRFIDEIFRDEIYREACPKFTLVDLGAYEGEFGFYCYNFCDKIYAVEPDPRPFEVMKKHVVDCELSEKMKIFPIAIGSKREERPLHASGGGGSSLMGVGDRTDKTVIVPTMSLNQFLVENGINHVDILKIDVESSEREIFEAEDFREAAAKIDLIIGETHIGNLTPFLEKFGFVVTDLPSAFIARKK